MEINKLIIIISIVIVTSSFTRISYATESNIEYVKIESESEYVIQGYYFDILCEIKTINKVSNLKIEWLHNNKIFIQAEGRWHETNERINDDNLIAILTIDKSKKEIDTGEYVCRVLDEKTYIEARATVTVVNENEVYIGPNQKILNYKIQQIRGEIVRMIVHYEKSMKSTVFWFIPNQSQTIITNNEKFQIDADEIKSVLTIKNVTIRDSEKYIAQFQNLSDQMIEFELIIRSEPIVNVFPISFYAEKGKKIRINCTIDAYPPAIIVWRFIPCMHCIVNKTLNCMNDVKESSINTIFNYPSRSCNFNFVPEGCGKIKMYAANTIKKIEKELEFCTYPIPSPLSILISNNTTSVAVGSRLTITCIASLMCNYPKTIDWFIDNKILENTKDVTIIKNRTIYSYEIKVIFDKIDIMDHVKLECRITNSDETTMSNFTEIITYVPIGPILDTSNSMKGTFDVILGKPISLNCNVLISLPPANIIWFKNNERIVENDILTLSNRNQTLNILFGGPFDGGSYKCVISNGFTTVKLTVDVRVTNYIHGYHIGWITTFAMLISIIFIFTAIFCWRFYKNNMINKQEEALGIVNFKEGRLDQINEMMTLDQQAELLPYDTDRFEFPIGNIYLGEPLGEGAFGIVYKAKCRGILPNEKESIVAVKMVKKSADNETIRALTSELKTMTHLGQHLNVINLLGAVTKNIFKRELMIIMEYCKYGNVQNFLLKNRQNFVNQIDPETDLIDPTIKSLSRNYENLKRFDSNDEFSNCTENFSPCKVRSPVNRDSVKTLHSILDAEDKGSFEDASSNDNNSKKMSGTEITTSDLIIWSFQVARGMDYLTSRKVLHGDLAARNILLCEDNVVKICDFGLARSIYKNEKLQKNEEQTRLPIRWLALESLEEKIFSTRTDVWSFGIMLWEFFSLSCVPYPGIEHEMLYTRLKSGYRMEKPEYANQELYEIMLDCWRKNPESRPLFNELEKRFSRILEKEVADHYIDLNEYYLQINEEYQKIYPNIWPNLMGSLKEIAPSIPPYIYTNQIEIKLDNTQK